MVKNNKQFMGAVIHKTPTDYDLEWFRLDSSKTFGFIFHNAAVCKDHIMMHDYNAA